MKPLIDYVMEEFVAEYKKLYDKYADPEFIPWFAQQPVDLLQEALDEFERYILENPSDYQACKNMMEKTLNEIKTYMSFHKKAKNWVESHEKMDTPYLKEISWRMKSPKKAS